MNLLNKIEADREHNRFLVYITERRDSPSTVASRDVEEVTEALRQQFAEKVRKITESLEDH